MTTKNTYSIIPFPEAENKEKKKNIIMIEVSILVCLVAFLSETGQGAVSVMVAKFYFQNIYHWCRFLITPFAAAIIKKTAKNKCRRGPVEKGPLGNINWKQA